MADYRIFNDFKGYGGAAREARATELKNQLVQAQIQEAQQKANYLDVDKLGEQALYKATLGQQLTPEETAAAKYASAKTGGIQFDPITGNMIQKPSIASNLGINFGGADSTRPATSQGWQPLNNPRNNAPQNFTPQNGDYTSTTGEDPVNPWDVEFETQMRNAEGNPKLQQSIQDAYAKAKISMTEAEAKNAGYADRFAQAEPILTDPSKMAAYSNFWQKAGDFINPFGAQLQSPEYKSYKQAQQNAATARLRQESGATISPTEFSTDAEQLYPQVGDTPEVLEQKRQNREAIKNSLMRAAGPAYKAPPMITGSAPNIDGLEPLRPTGKLKSPPMQAVQFLRANPQAAADFDAKYGQGASRMVLGK